MRVRVLTCSSLPISCLRLQLSGSFVFFSCRDPAGKVQTSIGAPPTPTYFAILLDDPPSLPLYLFFLLLFFFLWPLSLAPQFILLFLTPIVWVAYLVAGELTS
ncbi:hypothetical protein GGS23DRAFT_169414 [Durotheca rogersii]|uniref:uncharacterized protein n=1 Tax=Durotheca rogersii TaxID=419775 RepID=UPI002220407C|nr:uncharacterized protein GGS23DRAFT_169414 [Durotheca rogersii]KAI5867294.1 hypothetical protein GGS23DRAFT_169414 [Durotheca rogersii]